MQQFVNIRLVEADESLKDVSYDIFKEAYRNLVTRLFGWEDHQYRDNHERYWAEQRPYIIFQDDTPIGTIRLVHDDGAIEISQFCLYPEYHNKGIGSYILRDVLEKADSESIKTCLMCLKENPARSLYERQGFVTVSSDDRFYHMEREPVDL